MNERIKEFAEQVSLESERYCVEKFNLAKDSNQFFATMFSELIIERCLTQIKGSHLAQGYDRKLTDFEQGYRKGVETCVKNIEKEFGIKYM
jgi:hypothetical protein